MVGRQDRSGAAATCSGSRILDLAYDANQRLVAAAGNGVSETYGYDDQGRRIRKTSHGVTTW